MVLTVLIQRHNCILHSYFRPPLLDPEMPVPFRFGKGHLVRQKPLLPRVLYLLEFLNTFHQEGDNISEMGKYMTCPAQNLGYHEIFTGGNYT